MKTVYFHNPGELDIRGATTMGLSAKEADDAIGKFGTGLKYAIASVLRWGGALSIETGGVKYIFRKEPIDFRGKAHEQIIMEEESGGEVQFAQRLGYTTHYGSHWAPWQIFRELYSNAKDEGGGVSSSAIWECEGGSDTIITVHCPEVAECYFERDTIILPQPGHADEDNPYGLHYSTCPSAFLYYRSVRVRKENCLMTWNLSNGVDLTEDRSIESTWEYQIAIARFAQQCNDYDICKKILYAPEGYIENGVNYNRWYTTSEAFLNAAEAMLKDKGKSKLPYGVWDILKEHRNHLDRRPAVVLTKVQQQMLNRATELVCRMGLDATKYPIEVVNFEKQVLGQAKDGKVLLSPAVFEQGTKQMVSTLYEELLHLETGLKDCTYEMQTHLFNKLVSMYEEHVFGEAC